MDGEQSGICGVGRFIYFLNPILDSLVLHNKTDRLGCGTKCKQAFASGIISPLHCTSTAICLGGVVGSGKEESDNQQDSIELPGLKNRTKKLPLSYA